MITLITERVRVTPIQQTANVRIKLKNYQNRKSAEKQLKTILINKTRRHESADFRVVVTNGKRQGRGKLGQVLQIHSFKY